MNSIGVMVDINQTFGLGILAIPPDEWWGGWDFVVMLGPLSINIYWKGQ